MLAKILSCSIVGLEGHVIDVEIDVGRGLSSFTLVGLPDAAVKESGERVRSAIRNSGMTFPTTHITVNLAPAELKKIGSAYELPIALGLLAASEQVPQEALIDTMVVGELALDGGVRHVRGILPITAFARDKGFKRIIVPATDANEAALVPGIEVIAAGSLAGLVDGLAGLAELVVARPTGATQVPAPGSAAFAPVDFSEIKGQEVAKRALEIAASGAHNCIFMGSPGSGKTLLARALPGILSDLLTEESLEVTRIYSVADMLPPDTPLVQTRPFRAPHHTISHAGMVGGGKFPRPGEVSLAHRGVLFLDELPEFDARTLEVLRQPMEDKVVTISRASGSLTFPARFQLIAAMNPCKCGWYGDPTRDCTCSPGNILQYQRKISGPLLDRIDIHVSVVRVPFEKLTDIRRGDTSSAIRARVTAARTRQAVRFTGTSLVCNADMGVAEVRQFCELDAAGNAIMKAAMAQLQLSARAFHRVLKLSRTIADLAGADKIATAHLAEALQYRPRMGE